MYNSKKMKSRQRFFTPARIMCFLSSFALIIAAITSYNHEPSSFVIFPNPKISVFVINSVCALICICLTIFPHNVVLQCSILFIQAITTTLTNYEMLGTFLYAAFIILCFCNGFFKTKLKEKISAIIFVWFIVLILYGYEAFQKNHSRWLFNFLLQFSISVFFFGFYFYVYKKLETLLTTLVPAKKIPATSIQLPKTGTDLHLSNYNLTNRQIRLVMEYLKSNSNYEALSKMFYISKSTVKKDMTEVFSKFGVLNLKELHILLLQYIVKP